MSDCCLKRCSLIKTGLFIFLFVLILLIADQASKLLTIQHLAPVGSTPYLYPYGGFGVFKNVLGVEFSLNYMTNRGAAWGFLGDHQVPLIVIRVLLIFALILYLCFFNQEKKWRWPLLLIIAGAIGNVIDYFLYGHVIDMFHFVFWGYDYPVFNLADAYISIGVAWLLLISWKK